MSTPKLKIMLCMGVAVALLTSGCQTSQTVKKDPEKAVKVRSQLAAEY
ncbi:type IV pilus biogenesis/stability protein PilW, partial [Acinetobacter baumannii]